MGRKLSSRHTEIEVLFQMKTAGWQINIGIKLINGIRNYQFTRVVMQKDRSKHFEIR